MKKSQFPLLVNDNTAGFTDAVKDFENIVFPYVRTIKGLYDSLQLPTLFDDSVYFDIVMRQGKSLNDMVEVKIKNLPHVIGTDHKQSMFAARKACTLILNEIQNRTVILKEAYGRTYFKGRCFPLQSVINVDTNPEISPEAKEQAAESFRTYIQNEQEQKTFDLLSDFGATYNVFIQELKNRGYQNAGAGINESSLSDFFTETDNNTLNVREDAIEFLRGLSKN